ncbi:cytochrome ubiquinol oxidase subunit I, partial [Bacillus sp. S34]|nr:cytochrome ubiquinol oxidase subunit I [Bacillus sp. S34]
IGMAVVVAVFQTAWYRTGRAHYLQLTRFFGRIFLINFAMGVVTGIVQEFQFGMNWSNYSRFVGDVFGAPLALEAKGRAELTDIWAVLGNKVALAAFPHTLFACFMVAAAVIISVAAYHLARNQNLETMMPALKFGMWTMLAAGALTVLTGDQLGLTMVDTQPMKMAAAEALYNTATGKDVVARAGGVGPGGEGL